MKMRNNCIMYSLFGKRGEERELLWGMESGLSSLAFEGFLRLFEIDGNVLLVHWFLYYSIEV